MFSLILFKTQVLLTQLFFISKISNDDGLVFEIKVLFRHILANLIVRVKQIDLKHFATFKLNSLLYNHISDFYSCSMQANTKLIDLKQVKSLDERVLKQHELFKQILNKNELNSHYALISRQHELTYLRHISKQLLIFLLPDYVLNCK